MTIIDYLKNERSPLIMGIVNVTPDSFSDGGDYSNAPRAVKHGLELFDQGADILDIGGESTRPNAQTVTIDDEINRVVPVIKGLVGTEKYISIDTRNARTMQASIDAGANMINDVSALEHDPEAIHVVSQSRLSVCLMHMNGTPQTMQISPKYDNVIDEICAYFEARLEACSKANIDLSRVMLDPGIGFGKTLEHNLSIIKNLSSFKKLGCPILLGASRKSFIGKIAGEEDPKKRLSGSLATALYGAEHGVNILRVHDVKETAQALSVAQAISLSS